MNDRVISQKQKAISEAVETGLEKVRKEAGLNQLMVDTVLGVAAMSISSAIFADIENSEYGQILTEYKQLVTSNGYQGTEVGVAYYRKGWPIDTPDALIANEFIDHFLQTATTDLWEDCALGITSGLDENYPPVSSVSVLCSELVGLMAMLWSWITSMRSAGNGVSHH